MAKISSPDIISSSSSSISSSSSSSICSRSVTTYLYGYVLRRGGLAPSVSPWCLDVDLHLVGGLRRGGWWREVISTLTRPVGILSRCGGLPSTVGDRSTAGRRGKRGGTLKGEERRVLTQYTQTHASIIQANLDMTDYCTTDLWL